MRDYLKYRGKCREYCKEAVKKDPTLRMVRGFYHDPLWGKQQHWWTVRPDGSIYDPTAKQFPSMGNGEYEEFDGMVECSECGKKIPESEAHFHGKYPLCSRICLYRFKWLAK